MEEDIKEMTEAIVKFKEDNNIPLGKSFHAIDLATFLFNLGFRKVNTDRDAEKLAEELHNNGYYTEENNNERPTSV